MIGRGTRGRRRGRVDENQHYYTGGAVNLRLCFGCNRVFFQYRGIKQFDAIYRHCGTGAIFPVAEFGQFSIRSVRFFNTW